MGEVRSYCLTLWLSLWLFWLSAVALAQSPQGFAVQIAAVQTRAEAVALVSGLRARGLLSYWVRSELAGLTYYRIRVGGQFVSSKSAGDFGRKLVREGVVNTFSVLKYEPASDGGNTPGSIAEKKGGQLHSPSTAKTSPSETALGTMPKSASKPTAPKDRLGADYLITGEPQQNPAVTPSDRGQPSAPAKGNLSVRNATAPADATNGPETPRRTERGRLETRKIGDEIELDDFAEFAPQFLQALVEAKDGGLLVTLQNRNTRQRFRGTVNLNLRQNERERLQPAMQIEIAPEAENSFTIPGVGRTGSYLLTVYDERHTLQLMQQGMLGQSTRQGDLANSQPASTGSFNANPPSGNFPVTGGNVPPQPAVQSAQVEEEAPSLRTSGYPDGKVGEENASASEEPKNEINPSGDVKIIVRQVAASSENLTIEFEILAQQPLGMLVMAVHTTSMNDSKQAIMTTKQGRLPFLVPASDANGAISYELRDETGRLLATGSKAFQEIAK
jgi:hypothetical protein